MPRLQRTKNGFIHYAAAVTLHGTVARWTDVFAEAVVFDDATATKVRAAFPAKNAGTLTVLADGDGPAAPPAEDPVTLLDATLLLTKLEATAAERDRLEKELKEVREMLALVDEENAALRKRDTK